MAEPAPAELEGAAVTATGPEHRARVRYASRLTVSYRLLTGRKVSWPARVRDVSRTGLGLILDHRFEVGLVLAIELEDEARQLPRLLLVRVCHATPAGDGRWAIGCEFAQELRDEELDLLRC